MITAAQSSMQILWKRPYWNSKIPAVQLKWIKKTSISPAHWELYLRRITSFTWSWTCATSTNTWPPSSSRIWGSPRSFWIREIGSSPLTYSMVTTTLILEGNTGNTWASPTNLKEGLDTLFLHPSRLGSAQLPMCSQKIMRPLVNYWRGKAKKMLMYMDDGIGAAASKNATRELATEVKNDLHQSGLLVNSEKSDFQPRQFGEFLGYTLDLESGKFRVPRHKIDDLQSLLIGTLSASDFVTARSLARITGVIISMGLALGPVSRSFTRSLYHAQNSVPSLNCKVSLGEEAIRELIFWRGNFLKLDGQPIWQSSPRIDVISYSDASSTGLGSYVVQLGDTVARGQWQQQDARRSSTYGELKAIRLVLDSFTQRLQFKECKHRTDNQNTCSVLCIGSKNQDLQQEAIKIFAVCHEHGIRLHPEWIPRHLNRKADYWSRIIDTDDWMLNPAHFQELDTLWGSHTVDWFASYNSKQLPRFCARWQCPGCETVDAFTVGWKGENNWIVPPMYSIPKIIWHMSFGKEVGTLVIPLWTSAPWWPLVVIDDQNFKSFVVDVREIPQHAATFLPGSAESGGNRKTTYVGPTRVVDGRRRGPWGCWTILCSPQWQSIHWVNCLGPVPLSDGNMIKDA